MIFSLKRKDCNWKNIILFFLPLFYLYIKVISSYISLISTGKTEGRASYIILFTFIGLILMKGRKINRTIASAVIFTLYMMIYPLWEGDDIIVSMASYIIWPVVFYITYNMNYKNRDITVIGYLGAFTCNTAAYLYITLTNMGVYSLMDQNNAIAGYNSIYYVLLAFPFVFLVKNKIHVLLLTILPFLSFIVSTKTTCILSSVVILCYYFYATIRDMGLSRKLFLIVGTIMSLISSFYFFDFSEVISSLQEDVGSGGNGRSDIAIQVLDRFFNQSSFFEVLLGHGVGAVGKVLNIGAHNDFLETLYNYGLFGIGFFLLFGYNLVRNIKLFRYNLENKKAYIISLVVFLFCCMASKLLGTQIQMILLAMFWGVVLKQIETKA